MAIGQSAPIPVLVFKNAAGDYFLLQQDGFDRCRVPEEHKADVDRLIAETQADDTAGYRDLLYYFLAALDLPTVGVDRALAQVWGTGTGTLKGLEPKHKSS
jgi:hypothetical protein